MTRTVSTADRKGMLEAIADGFKIRVEIGIAGHLVHTNAIFCQNIHDARQAYREIKHKGNMVQVIEHFSSEDLGNNNEIYCGWVV